MDLFGYIKTSNETPLELQEVTFSSNSKELRELAMFLAKCADEIDEHGVDWEHEHFSADSRVIVLNAEA